MGEFRYSGRSQGSGEAVSGVCRARDAAAAVRWVQGQGILVVEIHAVTHHTPPWPFAPRLAAGELLFFTRQMAALCKAGVPLAQGLQGLGESNLSPLLKGVVGEVLLELQAGHALATALAAHPRVFDALYVKMVHMGEETGRLEETFLRLHDFLTRQRLVRQRFGQAIRYPLLVVVTMIVALLVIGIWVIPTFAHIFHAFGGQLPWITRGLLAFSHFLITFGPWVLVVAVVSGMVAARTLTAGAGRRWWGHLSLRLPLVGGLLRQMLLARLTHGLAMGFKSGLTLVKTLAVVGESIHHPVLEEAVAVMAQQVERGASFSRAARESGLFTPVALQMVVVGEESGQLDALLEQTADYYDQESAHAIATLQSHLQPLLTLFLAVLVLLLALGVFLPMWDLGHAALRR